MPPRLIKKGKVRDIYDAGENMLLFVASDRISAFDHVLTPEIPGKGEVLNEISAFWFKETSGIIGNHLLSHEVSEIESIMGEKLPGEFYGRCTLAKKAERINFECIVRGYISGGAWKEYKEEGGICSIKLPPGLKEAQKLTEPIFTPTTKADSGHDENISFSEMADSIGSETARKLKETSVRLYEFAATRLEKRGIILADTKLEFGFHEGKIILIDEIFTPDSSRFWPMEKYEPGRTPDSFDKQFVRNWLLSSGWDRHSPPPPLPPDIVGKTARLYRKALEKIKG